MDDAILQDLRRAYESGNLILFAGAGVSAAVGLPTWKRLAEVLRDQMRRRGAVAPAIQEVNDLIASNQLINALSAIKLAIGPQEFNVAVEKALDDTGREIPEVAQAIAALKPKLWAVLTTNIDRLLERAFAGEWDVFEQATGNIASLQRYIFKLHGTLRKWDTWVFSRDQYDRAMFGSPNLQDAFGALYRTHPILFVGCGLADDNLDQTFGKVRSLANGQPPMHFALVPRGVPPLRRRLLEEAGIRLIEYKNADGDHAEVADVLRALDDTPPPPPPPPAQPPPRPPMRTDTRSTTDRPGSAVQPVRVFFCYAPRDKELLERLETHLAPLKREGLIAPWHEGQIGVGEDLASAARGHLEAADLILLLISPDFLSSEQGANDVVIAMDRSDAGRALVMPILLRPSDWETSRFSKLQPFPRDKRPVTKWSDADEAFVQIAKELRAVATRLRAAK